MARPPISDEEVARIWNARGEGKTIEQAADDLEMSTRTVRKYCDKETAARLRATFKLRDAQLLNRQGIAS